MGLPDVIDAGALVDFTRALIRCQSWNPPGDEAAAAALVAEQLHAFGINTWVEHITPTRHNVYGRLQGHGGGRGHLLLAGHLDTVPPGNTPWEHGPLAAEMHAGRIYGRGATDMKSGLAAAIFAAGALAQSKQSLSGDLIIAGTAGEEVDCLGAQALAASGILDGVGAIAIPEPTALELVTAHKGALWIKVITQGRSAHGARPDLGVNAILHMLETVGRITAENWIAADSALLGPPTLNVATISGGTKANIVPDRCELTIDFRSLPGQDHTAVVSKVQDILTGLKTQIPDYSAGLEVINDKAAVSTSSDDPFVQVAQLVGQNLWDRPLPAQGITYYTDASVLRETSDAPVIILGPGDPAMAHQTDEWVSVDQLVQAAQFYYELARAWLA